MAGYKTPIFDWEAGDFKTDFQGRVLIAENKDALVQVVTKANSTPRGVFLIYADPADPENNHKYGSDVSEILTQSDLTEEARISEIKRAVKEALVYDPWVNDVTDIEVYQATGKDGLTEYYASFTLNTIFDILQVKGALLSE